MSKYDIVYSCTAHQNIDCLYNLYQNIVKFNPGINCLVIFNCSPELFNLTPALPEHSNLVYNPRPCNKQKYTCDIFLAHLSNYNFIRNYSFTFFCTLASNCLFVKPVSIGVLFGTTPNLNTPIKSVPQIMPDTDLWHQFLKNQYIANVFKTYEIPYCLHYHEGAYFRKSVWNWIFYFCVTAKITKESFTNDVIAFEEVLLPSFEKHCTGQVSPRYCALITDLTQKDLSLIIETGTCPSLIGNHYNMVKVPRDMNDPLRKLINQL